MKISHHYKRIIRGRMLPVFVLCLWVVLCACASVSAKESRVRKVLSGNTVELSDGTKLYYIGVDVPGKNKNYYEYCKQANKALVDKKNITYTTDLLRHTPDGKLFAYVYVGEVFINAEIIRQGYGLAHFVPPNVRYGQQFLELQTEARKGERGLWGFENMGDEPYYVGSKQKREFHRPGCFHAKNVAFDDRITFRTRNEALQKGYSQGWRCNPLFDTPAKKK